MPKIHFPLFSDCMDGAVVCCTSIQVSERVNFFLLFIVQIFVFQDRLKGRVISMSGTWESSLSSECTVLVSSEVGSNKYKVSSQILIDFSILLIFFSGGR